MSGDDFFEKIADDVDKLLADYGCDANANPAGTELVLTELIAELEERRTAVRNLIAAREAGKQPGEVIDIGRLVACDDCGEDYTNSKVPGGFVWHGRATCPVCADRVMQLPTQKIERLMKDGQHCPIGVSFADFVRELRGPNATITIHRTTGD